MTSKRLKEAQSGLVSAKHTLTEAQSDEILANVCCAQAIHAIIHGNDALTLLFFKSKGTRHDDAPAGFAKLIRENKIEKEHEEFKSLIAQAMRDKSGADYGHTSFSYSEAATYVERTEEFLARWKTT